MKPPTTIRIAAAVIRDVDGNLLLVRKRGTRALMQPGGKIEAGELPTDALARELREELGIVIDDATPSYIGRFGAPAANEPDSVVVAELFELSITDEPIPAAEIEEMIWLGHEWDQGIELAPLTRDAVLPLYGR